MLTICLLQAKTWARSTSDAQMARTFNMKDLGVKQILGIEIHGDRKNGNHRFSQQVCKENSYKILDK